MTLTFQKLFHLCFIGYKIKKYILLRKDNKRTRTARKFTCFFIF